MFCLVLTYGVPNILPDPNLNLYSFLVYIRLLLWAKRNPSGRAIVVLNAGATNPNTAATEAEVMAAELRKLLDREMHEVRRCIQLAYEEPIALDLWESMISFSGLLARERKNGEPIVIFCERHRRHRVEYIARRVLGGETPFRLISVDFDHREYRLRDYAARVAEFGSSIASWNVPWFYELLEHPNRMAKIGRNRDGTLRTH